MMSFPLPFYITTLAIKILSLAKMDIKNPAPKIRDGIFITVVPPCLLCKPLSSGTGNPIP
jgi:hypothetical protein